MDNFLTRLVRRTLGLMPVVQPMIASNFAPKEVVLDNYSSGFEIETNTTKPFWGGEMSIPPDVRSPSDSKGVWSKPVAGDEQREQGKLKFTPTTYDHTHAEKISLSNLPAKTSSLPENESSSLSPFEQLIDGNNKLIVDSSLVEITQQNQDGLTITQSDKQRNYVHNQAELKVISEQKVVEVGTLSSPLSQQVRSSPVVPESLLQHKRRGEEIQSEKSNNSSADEFETAFTSNLNEDISNFSQNPNPKLPDQEPKVFNNFNNNYLEKITPSQRNSENSLEPIEPLVKPEIETGLQAETKSSSLRKNEISSLSPFEQLVDANKEIIVDNSIEISNQNRELSSVAQSDTLEKYIHKQAELEVIFEQNKQVKTPNILNSQITELPLVSSETMIAVQPSESFKLNQVEHLINQEIINEIIPPVQAIPQIINLNYAQNYTKLKKINANKQDTLIALTDTSTSQQPYFVQLGKEVSPEKQENSRLGNEKTQESKVYASSIVNKFISQQNSILSNSKLRVNQELNEELQTSSDLSISQKERSLNRELAALTRRSLSVLSQPSSKQSSIDPITNKVPDSMQLNSTNRREVANSKHLAWQNVSHIEPTIQITIGRIEVRANNHPTSSTAPSKSSQRTPKLSLQDYLKQRQGEK